jgi:hypothetical protein
MEIMNADRKESDVGKKFPSRFPRKNSSGRQRLGQTAEGMSSSYLWI